MRSIESATQACEEAFAGRNVMVTGGLGFIGSCLARRLVQLRAKVLIVDSLLPEYGGNLFNARDFADQVRINISDVRDQNSMSYLVQGQDYIFNLAGQVSHIDSMSDPQTDLEINCRAQLSLLEACRRHNPSVKVIYTSTRQIYGKPDHLPVDEGHILRPTDVNGINKMAGEWYHILYNNVYGIRGTSLRLTNTYGPGLLMKNNRQGFVPWFIRLAIEGTELKIFGDGEQLRDFNYVDDAVEALLMAGASDEANGEIYNLGSSEVVSLKQFAQTLVELCDGLSYRLVPFPPDQKRIDIGNYYADYSKIRGSLGWEPRVPLKEGLRRTVEYYREYRRHYW